MLLGPGGELCDPGGKAGALGRQVDGISGEGLGIGKAQIFHQNPPADPVDHHVMHGDQQAQGRAILAEQKRAGEGAVFQVEPGLQAGSLRLDLGGDLSGLQLLRCEGDLWISGGLGPPLACGIAEKPCREGRMGGGDTGPGGTERARISAGIQGEEQRLVEVIARGGSGCLIEEPVLDRPQGAGVACGLLRFGGGGATVGEGGEVREPPRREDIARLQPEPRAPGAADQLDRDDAVAAELKETVVAAD